MTASATNKKSDAPLNPTTHDFEFMGPYLGPVGISLGLPLLTWAYAYMCNPYGWPAIPTADAGAQQAWASLTPQSIIDGIKASWSTEVFLVYVCYWLLQAVLYMVVPSASGLGIQLRDGKRLSYPFNGLRCLFVTVATAGAVHYYKPGGFDLLWIFDNFLQLTVATAVFAYALAAFLYAWSFAGSKLLAEGGNSKIFIYDWFIGRELNPRILFGALDLKYFCELRPGMFMWMLVNLACAAKQYSLYGRVDASMVLVLVFEGYYIVDSVLNEPAILTTMDITTDGFGFMLAFGDLAWVPMMYSLQARYLATNPQDPSPLAIAGIVAVCAAGFRIFRGANSQKDAFKRDPNAPEVRHLETIPTPTGSRLLVSGWWGWARHINYFGDWLMAVSWCLPCGLPTLANPWPLLCYFYPIYFAVLLWHRDLRDGHKCAHKYGPAWVEYCKRVPYHIIPYVY